MTASAKIELDHEWAPYQADVLEALRRDDLDLVVMRTGYGGGKSITGSRWIHRTALQYGGEYLVMAPSFQEGGDATYRVFFDELPGAHTIPNDADGDPENSPVVAGYNDNKKRLTYANGAIARLGSADKWNRYAGAEFNGIWCDEPAHYQADLYDLHEMLISRQRTPEGPNITLWTSTGAGYDQYYDITERKVSADGDALSWASRLHVIVASSLDNPFLNEKEKLREQFEGTPREDQALHGGFAAAQGLVYPSFSREHHVVDADRVAELVSEDADPIYGYDSGWDHPRVLVEWYPTHHDQWLATDSYYQSERPFEHLCDPRDRSGWVYDEGKPRTTVYCEHEPEHIQKFIAAGFHAEKANKSLDTGIPYIRGRLERDGEGRPGLLVSDACTELIQEFFSYKQEHVGKSDDVPDHTLDASRYALYTHEQRGTGDVTQSKHSLGGIT
jgi:hypothetical protein